MNNNNNRGNNNNNRRRGRGNRQGGGGGQQLNRIDSRARGNAPQLLEKYRKLAQDAHLNGDRVQAEYYLQFADHYFRVTADSRQRQDEQRGRGGERWDGNGADENDDSGEFSVEGDFPGFDSRFEQPSFNRSQPNERPRQDQDGQRQRDNRRGDSPTGGEAAPVNEAEGTSETADAEAQPNPYEPPANPFVRDRGRGLKPRRNARPAEDDSADELNQTGLDPASLPPAIAAARASEPGEVEAEADTPAKPRRGRPRKKPLDGDAGEALETVG